MILQVPEFHEALQGNGGSPKILRVYFTESSDRFLMINGCSSVTTIRMDISWETSKDFSASTLGMQENFTVQNQGESCFCGKCMVTTHAQSTQFQSLFTKSCETIPRYYYWLMVEQPSEQYDSQSGWWNSQLNGKKNNMFQTTNQQQFTSTLETSSGVPHGVFASIGTPMASETAEKWLTG